MFLSSCSHYYYAPNTHNVPVFKEKNEARITGVYSTLEGNSGELQAAYAPAKHVGILANALLVNPRADKTVSSGRGHLYELGAGYFKPFGPPKAANLFVFEVYGVAGLGGCRGYYPNAYANSSSDTARGYDLKYPNNYVTTSFVKAYIQPSLSISHDIFDVTFSAKIGVLHNYKITTTIPDSITRTMALMPAPDNGTLPDDLGILQNSRSSFVFEPAITARVGYKYVKFQYQLSFLTQTSPFLEKLSTPIMMSLGATINIAPRYKKHGWKLSPMDEKY